MPLKPLAVKQGPDSITPHTSLNDQLLLTRRALEEENFFVTFC